MHNRKHGTTTERRLFASDFHPGPARYVQLVSRAGIMQSTLLAWQFVCPPWQREEDTNDVNCSIAAYTDESVEHNSMPPSPANYARARWTTMRRLADGTAEVKRQSRRKRVSPFRPAQPGMSPPGWVLCESTNLSSQSSRFMARTRRNLVARNIDPYRPAGCIKVTSMLDDTPPGAAGHCITLSFGLRYDSAVSMRRWRRGTRAAARHGFQRLEEHSRPVKGLDTSSPFPAAGPLAKFPLQAFGDIRVSGL
ncbi:hypothetical protein Purlil1_715 [Purpureocillium lilacinum]|uniref:Uncharacterized protein n=1 Tax=Purpureocillium lilacinum TaxID=33203 RepID=A0ABR0CFU7_PURLI|nr:hypothetical protein Purlil1_715 [Purpureocillium lilacinum]